MLRRISLLQATILMALSVGLAETSNKAQAGQSTPSWDEVAKTFSTYGLDPLVIGPAAKTILIVAMVVAGLMLAFTEDKAERLLAAILLAVGALVIAANYVFWRLGW